MFVPWQRMIPDSSSAEQRRSIVGEHAYRATPSPASPLTPGKLSYIFLRRPQLSFGRRFSRQSRNAALTAAIPQIGSHRQTTSIGANRISPAIFFCARRHRRRLLFSRQLCQAFREYFFRISLHRTSRFRPLHGWFALRRLAMLLQGSISFSCDRTLSALITASLINAIRDRGSTFSSHLVSTLTVNCLSTLLL